MGRDGYTIPATQHDVVLWVAGAGYEVFDVSIGILNALRDVAVLVAETVDWSYHATSTSPALSTAPRTHH